MVVRDRGAFVSLRSRNWTTHTTSLASELQRPPKILFLPQLICVHTPSSLPILTPGDKRENGNVCLLGAGPDESEK